MENETDQINGEGKIDQVQAIERNKRNWIRLGVIAAAVIIVAGVVFFVKGFFIAATVNGSPISRLSIIKELEKQSGKQALDTFITKKLIETEADKKNIVVTQDEIDAEIKKIDQQIGTKGGTLDMALQQQGITREQFLEQITVQKKLEKLLADKIAVTDQEIDTYINDNKITTPQGQKLEDVKIQLKQQLQQQKFNQIVQQWITDLKANARIKYYVNY